MKHGEPYFVLGSLPRPPRASRPFDQQDKQGCAPGEGAEKTEGAVARQSYQGQGPKPSAAGMGSEPARWGQAFSAEVAGTRRHCPTVRSLTVCNN